MSITPEQIEADRKVVEAALELVARHPIRYAINGRYCANAALCYIAEVTRLHAERDEAVMHARTAGYQSGLEHAQQRIAELEETAARRLELLHSLEWSVEDGTELYCPSCEAHQLEGHADECELNAELTRAGASA